MIKKLFKKFVFTSFSAAVALSAIVLIAYFYTLLLIYISSVD